MSQTIAYEVHGMSCGHCKSAIEQEVHGVSGVERVSVDLEAKLVTIEGRDLDEERLRAAIDEAGYVVAAISPSEEMT